MDGFRSRAVFAGAVLSCALVSGGWFVERGFMRTSTPVPNGARLFDQVYTRISRDYVDTLPDSTLYVNAAAGLVDELNDPHSAYLPPKLLATLAERTSGRYAGVGAQIDVRDGWITIVAPLPGGPAEAAGIRTGDRIIEVNGEPMHGVSVEAAQKALRGNPGSVVRVTIERPGVTTPVKFALTRREIHVQSVQHATLLDRDIGYVALTIFSEESAFDLRHAIDSLRAAGMKTLIFDLRGDPGGLLDQGVGVADLFLDPGQRIVSMRGRTADANRWFSDRAPQAWPGMPVAVLVDTNTASAAEIVAGALQDHDRAVLIGSATYGKGSAQNVFPVGRGAAVKLTTARWFTPSGRSIDRHRVNSDTATDTTKSRPRFKTDAGRVVLGGGGISPDVRLGATAPTGPDTALERALGKQIPQFRDALTDYALSLKASGTIKSPDFTVTPQMRAELLRRLRARAVQLDSAVFERATPSVDRVLGYEVARYVFGQGAEFARRLHDDAQVARAVQFVRGATSPADLLRRAAADTARR
ncbi:MAG TPA: S41 family peptidase [Gemmatimonadaceae bacterium]|nr:S41 family peptidase [Gemmatimonadaceae bacterium]